MKSKDFFNKLKQDGLIVVIRGSNEQEALYIAEQCFNAGIKFLEVTFTIPQAHVILSKLAKAYENTDAVIGAGTVLDMHTARAAMLSGAQFIVAPSLDLDTVACCNRYQVPIIPGVGTATEVLRAIQAGAGVLKLFPGSVFRPEGLKALKGPFPQAEFIPTGGVNLDNIGDWFAAGALAIGVGGGITSKTNNIEHDALYQAALTYRKTVDAHNKRL